MGHKSDIEIAHETTLKPIWEVAERLGIGRDELELYGDWKAKLGFETTKRARERSPGTLILMTAITPTPAGEGKSTTTVGLGMALNRLGKRAAITLREPSLGPCFGIKGGAAGGGYAQVVPMEDINLHFTGDLHAITSAHALLSAMIDNHLKQGNELGIDPTKIQWKRVVDMNDRSLRNIVIGLGGPAHGVPREDNFMISVASEVMAVLCLAQDLVDLKERLGRIVVAQSYGGEPVYARDLGAEGAMAALLKDALKPNLVQTLENTPALVHGGPFANIAHGCNSLTATKTALASAEYVVTEAGFASDLGAEKFFNIKCRTGGLRPSVAVVVATARALKMHGGVKKSDLGEENLEAVKQGLPNLAKHIENMQQYGVKVVVAVNAFPTDTEAEHAAIEEFCRERGVQAIRSEVWARGGEGGEALAQAVLEAADSHSGELQFLYDLEDSIETKIEKIATRMYGADGVEFSAAARRRIEYFVKHGFDKLPICMAKTQASLSDNPTLVGRPEGFTVTIKELSVSNGAGFIVALAGDIMTMPGLPKKPAALEIDIDGEGVISGLF